MIPESDEIAGFTYKFFNDLPRKGKPEDGTQWTVLCSIVKTKGVNGKMEMVSLGTGSRCIGSAKMSHLGDVLNDSHAEVMARRGLLRYLYQQISNAYSGLDSIFVVEDDFTLTLKDGIRFHFFCTQTPCGDISNIRNENNNNEEGDTSLDDSKEENYDASSEGSDTMPAANKTKSASYEDRKRRKLADGIYLKVTGAKALDIKSYDDDDIGLGQPSTKPGRGSRTLSMSCSDKLAKWMKVGVQGALLSLFIKRPIGFHSITIGGGCDFSMGSFYRGLVDRKFRERYEGQWEELRRCNHGSLAVVPVIQQSTMEFVYNRTDDTTPCPASIVWCDVDQDRLQVAINGKKLGTTEKKWCLQSTALKIAKYHLFVTFTSLAVHLPSCSHLAKHNSYKYVKVTADDYYRKWNEVKENFFGTWTTKPDFLLRFQIENNEQQGPN